MRRYIEIYSIMLRNSLIRDLSFKANFLLWMVVEILWFCGQIVFFSIIFGNVDHIGDWTKWEVVLLVGTHQIIAQLFQAFFFVNVANIPELVRTGKAGFHSGACRSTASSPFPRSNSGSTASSTRCSVPPWLSCRSVKLNVVPNAALHFTVSRGDLFRDRRALFDHARFGRG